MSEFVHFKYRALKTSLKDILMKITVKFQNNGNMLVKSQYFPKPVLTQKR